MDEAAKYLISMGLPGIVIIGLSYACKTLWGRYCDSQDLRIKEGRESVAAISENTHVLDGLTQVLRDRASKPS